jgi:hypothetical protein
VPSSGNIGAAEAVDQTFPKKKRKILLTLIGFSSHAEQAGEPMAV